MEIERRRERAAPAAVAADDENRRRRAAAESPLPPAGDGAVGARCAAAARARLRGHSACVGGVRASGAPPVPLYVSASGRQRPTQSPSASETQHRASPPAAAQPYRRRTWRSVASCAQLVVSNRYACLTRDRKAGQHVSPTIQSTGEWPYAFLAPRVTVV